MDEQKKIPEPVEALVIILLAFGSIIVFAIVISIFSSFLDINISSDDTNRFFYIIGGLLFFIIPTLYIRQKKYDIIALFRLRPVTSEIIQYSLYLSRRILERFCTITKALSTVFSLSGLTRQQVAGESMLLASIWGISMPFFAKVCHTFSS